MIYNVLIKFITNLKTETITSEQKFRLELIARAIKNNYLNPTIKINFICTHNSRRSQFCQIWNQVISKYYGFDKIQSYSGGTEITTVHENVTKVLSEIGFYVNPTSKLINPIHSINFGPKSIIKLYSKLVNDKSNPIDNFIGVINCSDADQNCENIIGTSKKYSLPFDDPGKYDGLSIQIEKYKYINLEIASSLKYLYQYLGFIF
tara:strand:+ start:6371 stop:6985 length:615 start_codon:yes stop_codon:yes gene_type:complete